MTHGSSQSSIVRTSVSARPQSLAVAGLLLTASLHGGALAGSTAPTDAATVGIRVSVAPIYGLTRASHGAFLGDTEARLCVRTNAARPTLPVTGKWLDRDPPASKIVLPSCGGLPSPAALVQVRELSSGGRGIFLVSPE